MTEARIPPGATGLPFVGEGLSFVRDAFAFFEERYREHGPVFRTRLFGDDVVCLVGPDAFEKIYDEEIFTREKGSPPHVRELFHPDAIPFLGGEAQRRRRALLMAAFEPEAVEGYRPIVRGVIDRFLRTWAGRNEVRLFDEASALCFTISNALFAGADPERDDPELAAVFLEFGAGIFALPIKLPITTFGRAIAARDRLREYVGKAVDAFEGEGATHVLARLRAARDGNEKLSDDELRIELLHFFFAAHAALQGGIAHLTRALAEHPEVLARTRAAVDQGDRNYVSRVTKEARRAYKLAPTTFFAVAKKDAEVMGFAIKRGWKAVGIIDSTQRRVGAFDPDRFAEGAPEEYVAHGTGPWSGHRCAGEALADLVLDEYVTAATATYDWTIPDQDMTEIPAGFAPQPRDGLRVRFTTR